jgi:hypothetical protein
LSLNYLQPQISRNPNWGTAGQIFVRSQSVRLPLPICRKLRHKAFLPSVIERDTGVGRDLRQANRLGHRAFGVDANRRSQLDILSIDSEFRADLRPIVGFRRHILFLGIFIVAFSITALGYWSWRTLAGVEREARSTLVSISAMSVVPLENFLDDITALIKAEAARIIVDEEDITHLQFVARSSPDIASVVVRRLEGGQKLIAGSGVLLPDEIFVTAIQDWMKTGALVLTQPFSIAGTWYAALVYSSSQIGETPRRAVGAVFAIEPILSWWDRINMPNGSRILLSRGDGKIWMEWPVGPRIRAGTEGGRSVDTAIAENYLPRGVPRDLARLPDETGALTAWRSLENFPLVMAIGYPRGYIFSRWRDQNIVPLAYAALATLLAVLIVIIIGRLIVRENVRREAAVEALSRSEGQFRDFAETSSD